MRHRARYALLCLLGLLPGLAGGRVERLPVTGSEVIELRIREPQGHWAATGFVEITPLLRPPLPVGSVLRSRVMARIAASDHIRVETPAGGGPPRLTLPAGSTVARLELAPFEQHGEVRYGIRDVRAQRWDDAGREYLAVYRATAARPDAALRGFEWPRDNPLAQRQATELLTRLLAGVPGADGQSLDAREQRRVRTRNRCQVCHWPDKPQARSVVERAPPWATDAHGLFTPLAVFADALPLSTTPQLHDPGADDPLVQAYCPDGPARRLGGPGAYHFRCDDSAVPLGRRDVRRGLQQGDAHTRRVCAGRTHLYARMDTHGRGVFAAAMRECTGGAPLGAPDG